MNACTVFIDSYIASVFRCVKNTPDGYVISDRILNRIEILFTMCLIINAGRIAHPAMNDSVIIKLTDLGLRSWWISDPQGHKIIIPIGE